MSSTEQPKKEEKEHPKVEPKKTNSIANRIKNMASTEQPIKEEKEPPKEEPKKTSSIADRIKNMNNVEQPKKEEHKEEPSKPNPFADRIKNMGGNTAPSTSSASANLNLQSTKSAPIKQITNTGSSNATKPDTGIKKPKPAPAAGTFGSKLSQMNEMLKNKGFDRGGPGGHRPSMMIGMPQNFKFGKGGPSMGGSGGSANNADIIAEEPDKMKAGYDPAANLEKTLDSVVVVKKDKKKKKKPTTFNA